VSNSTLAMSQPIPSIPRMSTSLSVALARGPTGRCPVRGGILTGEFPSPADTGAAP